MTLDQLVAEVDELRRTVPGSLEVTVGWACEAVTSVEWVCEDGDDGPEEFVRIS